MESDLPEPGKKRDAFLLKLMGSGHGSKMQLDGLGSGFSSASKVAVLNFDSDTVQYNFAQVSLNRSEVDWVSDELLACNKCKRVH